MAFHLINRQSFLLEEVVPLHGNGWRPTRITRYIRGFATAAGTALVETDAGEGYLKAQGNPEGPHVLACELVGSMLADWLGLPTLDFALVEVTVDVEIPFHKGGHATPGLAFISKAEPTGFPWSGTPKELRRICNRVEINGLTVMDTWVLNCDRYAPDDRRRNLDNVFLIKHPDGVGLQLKAMDFTHAFTCGGDINRRLGFIEKIQDVRIYGLFPEFRDFLNREHVRNFSARLGQFSLTVAEEIISRVPAAWQVDQPIRSVWATMITQRAHFIADRIEAILWPQMELEGGTE